MDKEKIRVRFAPSPTGHFHVGGARTALYNWLFARKSNGVFILRIEDTDAERSTRAMTDAILRDMAWLGLDWDEGPFFQSERFSLYKSAIDRLVETNWAYPCFCAKEVLQEKKDSALRQSRAYRYDKLCRNLSKDEQERKKQAGLPYTIRFRTPENETIAFGDIVYGAINIPSEECDDFVIARSDGSPVYNLTAAIDDMDMKISHIIRGNEHIANTPKQILIYRALGEKIPQFAHLPLILGKDKKKLSKRHGATSIEEFRREGYLPEALVNYLALLGWSPGDDREFLPVEELIKTFSIERVGQAGAIFDGDKLFWLNSQYISAYAADKLFSPIKEELQNQNLWSAEMDGEKREWLKETIDFLKSRARTINEFCSNLRPYLSDDFPYDESAVEKRAKKTRPEHLIALEKSFSEVQPFAEKALEDALRKTAETLGVKAGDLIHPLRLALTGQMVGPSAFEVVEKIGREKTAERLERFAEFLKQKAG